LESRPPTVLYLRRRRGGRTPIALEVVRQIDALFAIERDINGQSPEKRRAIRQALSKPIAQALHAYLVEKRFEFSKTHDLYKAINYLLKRWPAFTLFIEDGRVCMSNNAAERALRGIALGRKSWLFAVQTAAASAPRPCIASSLRVK
jgi:transposase